MIKLEDIKIGTMLELLPFNNGFYWVKDNDEPVANDDRIVTIIDISKIIETVIKCKLLHYKSNITSSTDNMGWHLNEFNLFVPTQELKTFNRLSFI